MDSGGIPSSAATASAAGTGPLLPLLLDALRVHELEPAELRPLELLSCEHVVDGQPRAAEPGSGLRHADPHGHRIRAPERTTARTTGRVRSRSKSGPSERIARLLSFAARPALDRLCPSVAARRRSSAAH